MRLELTGRHVDITPILRRLVDAKLARAERLLNDSAVSAQAVLTREKYRFRVEITLHARGEKFLHGMGQGRGWEPALTQAVDKIAQQAQTVKGKWQERKRRGVRGRPGPPVVAGRPEPARPTEKPRLPRGLRATRQIIRLMSVDAAVREILARAEGLIVFRDPDRRAPSVLYRQPNGELTLVETDE
jgi:ribosomal subunit interface protein